MKLLSTNCCENSFTDKSRTLKLKQKAENRLPSLHYCGLMYCQSLMLNLDVRFGANWWKETGKLPRSHWYRLTGAEQPLNRSCSLLSFQLPIMHCKVEEEGQFGGLISAARKDLHPRLRFILAGGETPKIHHPCAYVWEKNTPPPEGEYMRRFFLPITTETRERTCWNDSQPKHFHAAKPTALIWMQCRNALVCFLFFFVF